MYYHQQSHVLLGSGTLVLTQAGVTTLRLQMIWAQHTSSNDYDSRCFFNDGIVVCGI